MSDEAENDGPHDAERMYEKAVGAVELCFSDGPVTGVLITMNNSDATISLLTLNHDFERLFGLLLNALHVVHERSVAGKVTHNYNLH